MTAGYLVYLRRSLDEFAFLTALGEAVDWLPAYVLLLPVRGLADAAIVLYQGFTPAMGVSFALWLVGVLLANRLLVRYQGVLYEVGASLARKGAAARASQRDPLGTYLQRKAERAAAKPLRTLRWLERWTPRGARAALARPADYLARQRLGQPADGRADGCRARRTGAYPLHRAP